MAKESKGAPGAHGQVDQSPADAGRASMASPKQKVRYQVTGKVFVNGSLIDLQGKQDVFVYAEPGLEGTALKLAPEPKAPAPASGGEGSDTTKDNGGGDGGAS